jgi:hypothetical protein
MPLITTPIQPAHVRYQGLGVDALIAALKVKMRPRPPQRMPGAAKVFEVNCELHQC